jgi:hypothetical protein
MSWSWRGVKARLGVSRAASAELQLAQAYRALIDGRATSDQQRDIVTDLADYSGFFRVSDLTVTGDQRAFLDGMRAVYGRLLRFGVLTGEELAGLADAARQEAINNRME